MQLYGALVPKLIGRKGKDNNENLSESSMTVDELFSHIPRLWKFIEIILQTSHDCYSQEGKFSVQRNLVPLLNLLSNTARRNYFKFSINNSHVCVPNIDDFFENFINLLESPLFAIRSSVAKIIELFYKINIFNDHCTKSNTPLSVNRLHGYLLVLKNYLKYFNSIKNCSSQEYVEHFISCFKSVLSFIENSKLTKSSFILNSLYLEILYDFDKHSEINYFSIMTRVYEVYKHVNRSEQPSIGSHNWINFNLNMVVMNCNEDMLVDVVSFCSLNFDSAILSEGLLQALNDRFEKKLPKDATSLKSILNSLIKISCDNNKYFLKIIFEVLYKLIEKAPTNILMSCEHLFEINFDMYKKMYMRTNCEYLIPFLSLILLKKCICEINSKVLRDAQDYLNIVREFLKSNKCDVEKKLEVIIGLNNLVSIITHLHKSRYPDDRQTFKLKSDVMSSIIWLLQDEDTDVRNESAKIIFFEENLTTFPYNVLSYVLSAKFLRVFFINDVCVLQFLQMILEEIPKCEKKDFSLIENPFDHEIKNIYLEPSLIKENILYVIKSIQSTCTEI